MNKQVKIFLPFHDAKHYDPGLILSDNCFKPILVGAYKHPKFFSTIKDSHFDNISEKNASFCELTAFYWMWKNLDLDDDDYVGLMHYRRHLCFNEDNKRPTNFYGMMKYTELNQMYIDECGLREEVIKLHMENTDWLLAEDFDVHSVGVKNNYDLYKNDQYLHIEDYERALDILRRDHPEYIPYIDRYNQDHTGFYTNIFVTKFHLFKEYCEWLFPILFELDEQIDISEYSVQEKRVIGHIAERLFGIYMLAQQEKIEKVSISTTETIELIDERKITERTEVYEKKVRVKKFPRTFMEIKSEPKEYITEDILVVKPQFENKTAIITVSTDSYAHSTSVWLESLLQSLNENENQEIYILNTDFSEATKNKFKKQAKPFKNIYLDFVDLSGIARDFRSAFVHTHFDPITYMRFYIPKFFKEFNRILYLDNDMIILEDVSHLLKLDLKGNIIAAVPDIIAEYFATSMVPASGEIYQGFADTYYRDYLKFDDIQKYFQAGVIVFDIPKTIENETFEKAMTLFFLRNFWFLDQDILNIVFKDNVYFLDYRYNAVTASTRKGQFAKMSSDPSVTERFKKAIEAPAIIHYCGWRKPWVDQKVLRSKDFFEIATKTPYALNIKIKTKLNRFKKVMKNVDFKKWKK